MKAYERAAFFLDSLEHARALDRGQRYSQADHVSQKGCHGGILLSGSSAAGTAHIDFSSHGSPVQGRLPSLHRYLLPTRAGVDRFQGSALFTSCRHTGAQRTTA